MNLGGHSLAAKLFNEAKGRAQVKSMRRARARHIGATHSELFPTYISKLPSWGHAMPAILNH